MAADITGMRVAFVVANEGVEEVELTEPWKAVERAGGRPELLAPEPGDVQAFEHFTPAHTFPVDHVVTDAAPEDYAALVLPGGVGNADQIRGDAHAVHFVRHFVEADKPIAVICHGPWILVEAGGLDGRVLTSWPTLSTDITNAGGKWVDEEVRVDGNLTSSRKPDDLPAFCRTFLQEFAARQPTSAPN